MSIKPEHLPAQVGPTRVNQNQAALVPPAPAPIIIEAPPQTELLTTSPVAAETAEAFELLGEMLETQAAATERVAEAAEEVAEEIEEETEEENTTEPEENAFAQTPAPAIQSDVPAPKNEPPQKPQSHRSRNGLRKFLFGE